MLSRRLGQAFVALVTFATAALWIAPTAALAAGGPYEFRPYLNTLKCIDDPHGSPDSNDENGGENGDDQGDGHNGHSGDGDATTTTTEAPTTTVPAAGN